MLKKERVIELYEKYRSKRRVAQELNVSRQYVIQVIQTFELKPKKMKVDLKTRARQAVTMAVKAGKLTKQPCSCGVPKAQAHHPNGYDKENWLNITWLCGKHHYQIHHPEPLGLTPLQKSIIELYKEGKSKLGIATKVEASRTYVYKVLKQEGLI